VLVHTPVHASWLNQGSTGTPPITRKNPRSAQPRDQPRKNSGADR
jgi:hypothetical protein